MIPVVMMESIINGTLEGMIYNQELPGELKNNSLLASYSFHECNTSQDAMQVCDMSRIGHGIIIPIIAGIGMFLNVLNLIVLCNGKLSESTYTYLTGLAVADFGTLAVFFVNGIGRGFYPEVYEWRIFEAYVYFPCGLITTTAGVLLTVMVSVERIIFIYRPIKAKLVCRTTIARKLCTAVWLFSIFANMPRFFVFALDERRGDLGYSEFGKSVHYNVLSWFYFIAISCGCGIALIILNAFLMHGIHRTNLRKRHLVSNMAHTVNQQKQDELRLTRTLISVVTIYLIGEIPSALLSRSLVVALIGHGNDKIVKTMGFKIASLVATILVVLQLSLNFVVYCVFNRRFWALFKQQFCSSCLCFKDDSPSHSPQHDQATNGHCHLLDPDNNSTEIPLVAVGKPVQQ